jgi:hypothetical protein
LFAAVETPGEPQLGLGEDLRALTLISLGMAEVWALSFKDADQHLEQGVALAHRIGRPYLEFTGLAHSSELAALRSYTRGAQRSRQAIDLARQHGWSDEPFVAVAYTVLGGAMVSQGRWQRLSDGSGTPRALFNRTLNRPSECISTTRAGASKWPAAVMPTRSRPSGSPGS